MRLRDLRHDTSSPGFGEGTKADVPAAERTLSIVVPTYRRGRVLVRTLEQLAAHRLPGDEIIVVDQTEDHDRPVAERLRTLQNKGVIRWIQQHPPSLTRAMNRGLLAATRDLVLFVDDDIVPEATLLQAHRNAHVQLSETLVAGRVIQPWEERTDSSPAMASRFAGRDAGWLEEFMGGNFSLRRQWALELGGFDENFVRVAYRFEAEFAHRLRAAGGRVWFEPLACLHHLREEAGGTRTYGKHLTSAKPDHAVGAYYCTMRTRARERWPREFGARAFRSVSTRHHLRRPWWIPVTLCAEARAMLWALRLYSAGPRLIEPAPHVS